MEDRRVFERFAASFPLRFIDSNANRQGQAQTVDVSAKGVGLVTDRELSVGVPLEMWLGISDDHEPLYMRGEVVWSNSLEPNRYRVGVDLERADFMGMSRVLRA